MRNSRVYLIHYIAITTKATWKILLSLFSSWSWLSFEYKNSSVAALDRPQWFFKFKLSDFCCFENQHFIEFQYQELSGRDFWMQFLILSYIGQLSIKRNFLISIPFLVIFRFECKALLGNLMVLQIYCFTFKTFVKFIYTKWNFKESPTFWWQNY